MEVIDRLLLLSKRRSFAESRRRKLNECHVERFERLHQRACTGGVSRTVILAVSMVPVLLCLL
jgi:hypothetical protein